MIMVLMFWDGALHPSCERMLMALPDSCANPIFCVQQMGMGTWQNVCRALVKLPPVNFSLSVWQEKRSSFQHWMCFLRMSYVYAGVRTQAQIVTVPWWWCISLVRFPLLALSVVCPILTEHRNGETESPTREFWWKLEPELLKGNMWRLCLL